MCRGGRVVHNTSDVQNRTKRRGLCRREKRLDDRSVATYEWKGTESIPGCWWYLMAE